MLTPARSILTALTLAAMLACCGRALASTPVPSELLDALKDEDFAKREEATTQLLGRADITLKNLDHTLTHDQLSTEQRARLLAAAKHRFATSPRAALGVSFAPGRQFGGGFGEDDGQVRIGQVIGQFPAARVLRAGDIIVSIDGWKVDHYGAGVGGVRPYIISHDPGDEAVIEVLRGGESLRLTVPLGNYADLNNQAPLGPGELGEAWDIRSTRYRGPSAEPVLPATENLTWYAGEGNTVTDLEQMARTQAARATDGDGAALATGGGQSTGGRDLEPRRSQNIREEEFRPLRNFRGDNQIVVNVGGEVWINGRRIRPNAGEQIIINGPNGQQMIRQIPVREAPKAQSLIDERMVLVQQHEIMKQQVKRFDEQAVDPMIPAEFRGRLKTLRDQTEAQRVEIKRQIDELNAKIAATQADQQPVQIRKVP